MGLIDFSQIFAAGNRSFQRILSVLIFLLAFPAYGDSVIGHVLLARGEVIAVNQAGDSRGLSKNDQVFEGDSISTGVNGYVVVNLLDGEKLSLRQESSLILETFSQSKGQESLIMSLLKGGLRAITGEIGKTRPSAYETQSQHHNHWHQGHGFYRQDMR